MKGRGIETRCEVIKGDLEKAVKGKLKNVNLGEATVVFYGLSTSAAFLDRLRSILRKNCKLVYYYNCLFPEIMPIKTHYPFLLSKMPFIRTSSEREWLTMVTGKKKSSLRPGMKPSLKELWDELHHDHDIVSTVDEISAYKSRLRKTLKRT